MIHALCVYTWTQSWLLGWLSSPALRNQSQISPWRQGSTKDGAGGSSGPLAPVQSGEKKVNQVLPSLWENPASRSPTPLLPMAQAGPQESAPTLSTAQRFNLCLIWYKRKEEIPCEPPTHLHLAEDHQEQEVLLAITRLRDFVQLGNKAQKMKKKEHIPF